MNAHNFINLDEEDTIKFVKEIYDFFITKKNNVSKMKVFNNFYVVISCPNVTTTTPFGNVYAMSFQYKYKGFDLGLYTSKAVESQDDLLNLIIEITEEFTSYLNYWVNKLDNITIDDILDNHNFIQVIKPGDSQRVYRQLSVANCPISQSMQSDDIITGFPFPQENDTYELYQYHLSKNISNNYENKKNFHYLTDNHSILSSILEFKTPIPFRDLAFSPISLKSQLKLNAIEHTIFHNSR